MDALILCGGFATRLEPITLFVPKPLLPIGGRPILDHITEGLDLPEIDRVVVSVNKKFENQFMHWADCRRSQNFKKEIELVVEPTTSHGSKFGAIKGIDYAIEKAGLGDDLLIIAGDNFYEFRMASMLSEAKSGHKAPTVCVYDVLSTEEAKKFGVVVLDKGMIADFEEKPAQPKSTLISTGIYFYPKETLGKFREYLDSGNTPDAPGYFLQWLIKRTAVKPFKMDGKWFDIGTLDTYKKVFSMFE